MSATNFESGEHALVAGLVMGSAWAHGFNLEPVLDSEGNYTPKYRVTDKDLQSFVGPNVEVFITIDPPREKESNDPK